MLNLRHHLNKYRHRHILAKAERKNSNCSRFMRNAVQLDALVDGAVIDHVLEGAGGEVRIGVLGCSYGPEPVSIASLLAWQRPDVDFRINGYDIDDHSLAFARKGVYEHRHVFNHDDVDPAFVERTFTKTKAGYAVKDSLMELIEYHHGDATNEDLADMVGPCDIVFAQHFLYHLDRETQTATFRRIAELLPPHGVLFADGMDLDLRQREVARLGLRPWDYKVREIHEVSRQTPWASSWPYSYYGLEPLVESGDWQTRYATIFARR